LVMSDNSYMRSRSSNVMSSSSSQQDDHDVQEEVELLDIDEQEAMIQQLHQRSNTINEIYRFCFSGAGLFLTAIFLYFAYTGEEFGENIGKSRASLVHFLTAVGCLIVCVRAKKARKNSYIVATGAFASLLQTDDSVLNTSSNNGNNLITSDNNKTTSGEYRQLQFDSPKQPQTSSNSSLLLLDNDVEENDNEPLFFNPELNKTSDLGDVLRNPNKLDWQQKQGWWSRNTGLVITLMICIIELGCWYGPMRAIWALGTTEALAKPALFIFPCILPLYAIATEYAVILMQRTEDDVFSLHDLKYHYKKL